MKNNDFCIFIISNGRPDNVITYYTLKKQNCIYPIYIIVDNQDKSINKYIENFGTKNVFVFDKIAISKTTDSCDNFNNLRTTTHARNACFEIAEKLNYNYFLVLDDDYTSFLFTGDEKLNYSTNYGLIKNINSIFDIFLDFYKKSNALSICFAQGGDFIGGPGSNVWKKKIARKAMNSFFCSTFKPYKFISRLNEDVNTYLTLGSVGKLFFTIAYIRLEQKQTQSNAGGMTESYLESGTYVKSFYTVMNCPSFAKIKLMGVSNKRLHHNIKWNNAVPKLISENYKKLK
jgi:hypothetical protein